MDASDPIVERIRASHAEGVRKAQAIRDAADAGDPEALAIMAAQRRELDRLMAARRPQARPAFTSHMASLALDQLNQLPKPEPIDIERLARRWREASQPEPPTSRDRALRAAKTLGAVGGWVVGLLAALHALGVI